MISERGEWLKALRAVPAVAAGLSRDLDDEAARHRPAPEEWSPVEVVAHMADTDERALVRISRMLAEDAPDLPSFDQAQLAVDADYRSRRIADELQRLALVDGRLVARLETLDETGWMRTGRHAEHGDMTVQTYVAHVVGEDIDHLGQLALARSGSGRPAHGARRMRADRRTPDLPALFGVLAGSRVDYIVIGSTAALLQGVVLTPGDLDITPSLDPVNLARLASALSAIDAQPDPDGPFGDWELGTDGERRWIAREPRPGERESRLVWRPDATDPASFDQLLQTRFGALDIVPEISGRYEDLVGRAARVTAFGHEVLAASIADQLATLTIPRRERDRARVEGLRERQR
jgi:uncharacterized damage-inducible protein DinB